MGDAAHLPVDRVGDLLEGHRPVRGTRPHEAARHGAEATELYTVLGARWDLRRISRRLDEFGVIPDRAARTGAGQ